MRKECDRLRLLLEEYEAQAAEASTPDHHVGLRARLAALERKLSEGNPAWT